MNYLMYCMLSIPSAAGNSNEPYGEALHVNLTRRLLPRGLRSHQPPSSLDFCFAAPFVVQAEHQHIQRHSALSLQRTIKSVLMLPACHLLPQ